MTNAAKALTAHELLRVLAKIDVRGDRWRRKVRMIQAIGSWGMPNPVSVRELGLHAECSPHTAAVLLEELIEARIVLVVALGAGRAATSYVVNRELEQWGTTNRGRQVAGGVPWLCSVPEARFWTFHVAPPPGAEVVLSRASGPVVHHNANLSRASGPETRDYRNMPRASGPEARDKLRPARGVRAALARQLDELAQEGSPGVDPDPSPRLGTGAGGEQLRDDPGFRKVAAAVKAAARAKFLEGEPRDELARLYTEAGADWILEQLPRSPVLGAPRLVRWLVDERHQPDPELLERLAQREEPPPETPEPARPVLPEYQPDDDGERADPALVRSIMAGVRSRTTPQENEGGRMPATGGAHP